MGDVDNELDMNNFKESVEKPVKASRKMKRHSTRILSAMNEEPKEVIREIKSPVETSETIEPTDNINNGSNNSTVVVVSENGIHQVSTPIYHQNPELNNSQIMMRAPSSAYIKTVQRRGNTYLIKESLPSDDDIIENDSTERMINDLYAEALHLSYHANRKASFLKAIHIASTMFITIAGAIIGVLSIDHGDSTSRYTTGVLGFAITTIKTLTSTFAVEKKSVLLKETAARLKKLSRDVRSLQNENIKPKKKISKLDAYYAELDELDMNIFDLNNAAGLKKEQKSNSDQASNSDSEENPKRTSSDLYLENASNKWKRRGSNSAPIPV